MGWGWIWNLDYYSLFLKIWGKKTLRRAKFKSPVPGWVVFFFFYHHHYHHHFKKKNRTAINGIPANHLVSLVWRLTDSSPCQSAFGFATLGPLSLSLSASLTHSAASLDKGSVFIKEPPVFCHRGAASDEDPGSAARLRRAAAPLSDSLSPSP